MSMIEVIQNRYVDWQLCCLATTLVRAITKMSDDILLTRMAAGSSNGKKRISRTLPEVV
jgi:hypothetical protein